MTDSADDQETVIVPANFTRSSRTYHTDPDCKHVTERCREWALERAELFELRHCQECAGVFDRAHVEQNHGYQRSLIEAAKAQEAER